MMWTASLPIATNPFMDDHLIYAMVIVGLWLIGNGHVWAAAGGTARSATRSPSSSRPPTSATGAPYPSRCSGGGAGHAAGGGGAGGDAAGACQEPGSVPLQPGPGLLLLPDGYPPDVIIDTRGRCGIGHTRSSPCGRGGPAPFPRNRPTIRVGCGMERRSTHGDDVP